MDAATTQDNSFEHLEDLIQINCKSLTSKFKEKINCTIAVKINDFNVYKAKKQNKIEQTEFIDDIKKLSEYAESMRNEIAYYYKNCQEYAVYIIIVKEK